MGVERRRFRRASVAVDVAIRPQDGGEAPEAVITGAVKDISLAGVYCYTKIPCTLKPGDGVICSVSVPPEQARGFPFSRLLSKGWVVRVEPVQAGRRAGEEQSTESLCGLAVAFAPDVTALGTIARH